MNVETLYDLFVSELQRLYGVETALVDELAALERDARVDTLDGMQETEPRERLLDVLEEHRTETETHVERLEAALEALGQTPDPRSTPALEGLVDEKELFNNVVLNDEIRPPFYLGTCKGIERLEITAYERLLVIGDRLDVPDEVIDRLQRNLEEEEEMLRTLESLSNGEEFGSLLDGLAASADQG